MCDCSSEDSSNAKHQPIAVKSCDCTSEDESEEAKIKIHTAVVAKAKILQSNATDSCDCTSEDDSTGTTESCDCTSEEDGEDGAGGKMEICHDAAAATTNDEDLSKSPFEIVQVELSESMLKLLPSSESSTSCDCTSSSDDACQEDKDKEEEQGSCDCTSEESSEESCSRSEDRKDEEKKLEWTLAMIKPEAVRFRGEIERIMEEEEGFSICQRRWLHLTAEQASEFYCDNYGQKDFARLVAYMSSKPIIVYVLSKLDAITEWRMLIGPSRVSQARVYAPDSIRGRFGERGDDMRNAVHGSCDARAAEREIHFFFPDCILEPVPRDEAAEDYLREKMNEVLSEALVKCCEAKPDEPLLWLANWLLNDIKHEPRYLLRSTSNLYD